MFDKTVIGIDNLVRIAKFNKVEFLLPDYCKPKRENPKISSDFLLPKQRSVRQNVKVSRPDPFQMSNM